MFRSLTFMCAVFLRMALTRRGGTMKRSLLEGMFYSLMIGAAMWSVSASAQGPPAPLPTCEEQLNNEMFQAGQLKQQLAVARAQLGEMTKDRDATKAALAKLTPKPAAAPEKK